MMTDYGFVLARGDKGFRHFLKYTLFEADTTIANFESKDIRSTLERADSYVIARRIKRLYQEFLDQLTEEEKYVVDRIRRGKIRYQEYASFYGEPYKPCYEKIIKNALTYKYVGVFLYKFTNFSQNLLC